MIKPGVDMVAPLEETKRIGRVLRIVQLISSHPQRWSRARLAQEFELSERMIDNDLQLIRHALRYEMRRAQGGYYFTESPLVKPVHLSLPETLALALSAQQARQTGTGGAILIHNADTEQGFQVRMHGSTSRSVVDFEGLSLVRIP